MAKIIDRGLAGPDDPIYKGGLRVSSVPGSSVLTRNSQASTAGGQSSDLKAAASLQDKIDSAISEWDKADGLTSPESTTPDPSGKD